MIAAPSGTIRRWLDERAETNGTAYQFFDDPVDTFSWSDLRTEARSIAHHLTSLGIKKGASVAVIMPNGSNAVRTIFGVLYGGFRATLINLVAGDDAISYALEHSESNFALVGEQQQEVLRRCAPNIVPVVLPDEGCDFVDLYDVSSSDDAILMYTSGTTGRPKGVVHTQASLLAGGWTTTQAHALTPEDCGFCVLPVCHINALCVSVIGGLVSGCKIAMAPKFSASRFWGQIAASEATWFSVVPTIISHLLQSPTDPTTADKKRLRFGRSA
ncbi:MAG: AMP-binding protein, partial [Paracoccaceae bacterium]|nr:AMP-binding protein [Paracoccaceae bacterium]